MLHIHPILQTAALLLALYALYIGLQKFRISHLNRKGRFNYAHHVRFGTLSTTVWLFGTLGGLFMVKTYWSGFLLTGRHGYTGLAMIPLIIFALGSGIYMHRYKKKRTTLPLVHGALNTLMVILGLYQLYTGTLIYLWYVLDL